MLDELRGRATCSVAEAGQALGLGRSLAYAEARRYLETGEGLPVLKFGRLLLVPVPRLLALLGVDDGRPGAAT